MARAVKKKKTATATEMDQAAPTEAAFAGAVDTDPATSHQPPQPARDLQIVEIPIGDIDYNPDNYNRQDEKTFKAETDSILTYGFVDPCLLRPYSEEEITQEPRRAGRYEMIDGEHRVRSLYTFRELGGTPPGAHPQLADLLTRWVVPCIVRPMSKAWANKLLAIMSETRGKGDELRRAQLFASLAEQMTLEELVKGLPYDPNEMKELLAVGTFDWKSFEDGKEENGAGTGSDDDDDGDEFKLTLVGPGVIMSELLTELRAIKKRTGWNLSWKEPK